MKTYFVEGTMNGKPFKRKVQWYSECRKKCLDKGGQYAEFHIGFEMGFFWGFAAALDEQKVLRGV